MSFSSLLANTTECVVCSSLAPSAKSANPRCAPNPFYSVTKVVFILRIKQSVLCLPPSTVSVHTLFVSEELDQVMGLSLYPTLHSFIPHSQFSESSDSKMSLLFPDETIWDQDTFSHQEWILCHIKVHTIVNDKHNKSNLVMLLLKEEEHIRAVFFELNGVLLEKTPWLR